VPMRNEIAVLPRCPLPADASDDPLAVLAFCLIGVVASLYFAAYTAGLDQLPLLVIPYDLG
jgi:hypothetical protein